MADLLRPPLRRASPGTNRIEGRWGQERMGKEMAALTRSGQTKGSWTGKAGTLPLPAPGLAQCRGPVWEEASQAAGCVRGGLALSLSDIFGVIHTHLLGFSPEDLRGELEKEEKGTVVVKTGSACYCRVENHSLLATVPLGSGGWFPLPALYSLSLSMPHSANSCRPRGAVGLWSRAEVPCPSGCLGWGRLVNHLQAFLSPVLTPKLTETSSGDRSCVQG